MNLQIRRSNLTSGMVAYLASLPNVGNRLIYKLLENQLLRGESFSDCIFGLKSLNGSEFGGTHNKGILNIKESMRDLKPIENCVQKSVLLNRSKGVWLWGETQEEFSTLSQVFWGIGDKLLMSKLGKVGIVGTRKSTPYGTKVVDELVNRLRGQKYSVWSGFASGIDMAAHQSALKYGVKTVAVAPFSVLTPTNTQNIIIKEVLNAGGAVICNVGKPEMTKGSFLARNILLSSLVDMLFVVEAPIKSGTLHTAKECLKLNKPVFVIPGNIFSKSSEGCNWLLTQEGVSVVTSTDYLDGVLGFESVAGEGSGVANEVIMLIKSGFDSISTLSCALKMQEQKLTQKLTYLELKGILQVNKFGRIFIK